MTTKKQYYPIAPITDFVLSEHTNNLYKQVANSSIDLAKRCADKINEIVKSFNALAEEKWEKIHEQDGKIRSATLYMKDNLINSIYELFEILKNNGELDHIVTEAVLKDLNNLITKLESSVSVKEFGAIGNGYADDTRAIQKALNTSKTIILPKGTYLVNSTITIPPETILKGSGRDTIIKMKKATGDDINSIILLSGDHCSIEDLSLDGSDVVNGIAFKEHTYHFNVKNVLIRNCLKGLYDYQSLWMGQFNNIHCVNCEVGFSFANNNDKTSLILNNCWCENCGTPYRFYRVNYSTLNGCGCDWCNYQTNNPYTKGYGKEDSQYGLYHFELCKGITMNGCGSENSYGNGLIYLSATSLVVNGLVATNIKSKWKPYFDENPKVRVGDIFLSSEKNKLVLNGYCFNSRFENTYVKEIRPNETQPIIAYNYDEKVYGKQSHKSVIVSCLQDGGNVVFDGCGNYLRDCVNLDSNLIDIYVESLNISGYKHFGAKVLEATNGSKLVIPMKDDTIYDYAHKLKISGISSELQNRTNPFYVEVSYCSSTFVKQITLVNSSNGVSCEESGNQLVINLPNTYSRITIECEAISDKIDLIDWDNVQLI